MNDDQLQKIEEYSGLFLTPEEIAILIEIDFDSFSKQLKNKNSKAYKHYMRGKTITKMEIRKNIILMAKNGSPQAEILANKFMSDQAVAETDL